MEENLIFFDKEGNSLNFYHNQDLGRYEGDLIFHENSNDTFKTQALYLCEKVPAFEYENISDLTIKKFQLFNEFGFHFYPGRDSEKIDLIEPVNVEDNYYSKWIYGKNFESKFQKGSFIRFDVNLFEFTNQDIIYPVVGSKKGAILILSTLDNDNFESVYGGTYSMTASYVGKTISGVDIIGIYDYLKIYPSYQTQLSLWNEYDFSDRIYEYRKLNIVNSEDNDNYKNTLKYEDVGVVTVKNPDVIDIVHYEYNLTYVPTYSTLWIEVMTRTDLPLIYQGSLIFSTQSNSLGFGSDVPSILKPGIEIQVTNSSLNSNFLNISTIPTFLGNTNMTYYATGSQVLYDNRIYECIQAYTWSGGMSVSIIPDGSDISLMYWGDPTYLPIDQTVFAESLSSGTIYLTTDHLYFSQSYTQSSVITLASSAQRFQEDLNLLNIDFYYLDNTLKADLIYPGQYAIVNFYYDVVGVTYSIGTVSQLRERAIETYERLEKEFNYNVSENFSYNIVFTDLDEYGMVVTVNKMVYQEEISWVYSSGSVDMERTIDKTLRNWLTRNFIGMITLGIIPSLLTIGNISPYYNSINIQTEYPNVPIAFDIKVGSTGDFYIEDKLVSFYDMGRYLLIRVNGRDYGEDYDTDIPTTLTNWVDSYYDTLEDYGIYTSAQASSLRLNVKKQNQRLDLSIFVGKSSLPGNDLFIISNKIKGNHGVVITSNEILMATSSTDSFEEVGFSTGMVTGINKTFYPLQNVEFNTLFLDPNIINLSYEGPFWGLSSSICNSSALTTVAFTIGFGQTACPDTFLPDLFRGMYDNLAFNSSFSIEYLITNSYSVTYYPVLIPNMVDIIYVQPVNSIYAFGDDIAVVDAITTDVITTIILPSNANSIEVIFNPYSNYLYALSQNILYRIDPYINQVVFTYSFVGNANAIISNPVNGDLYISFNAEILVYSGSTLVSTIATGGFQMTYNSFEGNIYAASTNAVLVIDGTTRLLLLTHAIVGVSSASSIEYDPENESVYVSAGTNLYKIDNSVVSSSLLTIGSPFSDLIFNNLTSDIVVSSQNSNVASIDVDTDVLDWTGGASNYGYIELNQHDGSIYLSGQSGDELLVLSSMGASGSINILDSLTFSAQTTRLVYNPDRRSMWLIQPSTQNLIEVVSFASGNFNLEFITTTQSNDIFYGTLDPNYLDRTHLWVHTREYIRKPRENFNGGPTVSLYCKWFSDNVPEFFLYDFSGSQLPTDGVFAYTGDIPLDTVYLNKKANREIEKIDLPQYQQTVFDVVEHELDFLDSNFNVNITPEPIEFFVGFNSPNEGPLRSVLQLYKKEYIDFTITPDSSNLDVITFETIEDDGDRYGRITIDQNSTSYFTTDGAIVRGLKPGQHLAIFVKDITNIKQQYISNNNGYLVKIRNVYSRIIEVDFFKDVDLFESESTIINNFPKSGNITYLSCRFKVWDKEIGRFNVYGQTEIEDIRYKIELNNVGKLISSDDVYIFKEYDIKEEGIDWVFLNKKRKEMLLMKSLIYSYIGSYKSIINAINYFGYNDLELYEYYRNVDIKSKNYLKLFKVEIPDIFDNSVEGWTENDFIKHTFPNDKYEDTNLFNLTYRITDGDGNNILLYTLEEVQKKLQGLKYWLQKNIIPISHKILDITGRADFVAINTISHQVRDVSIFNIHEDFTPVSFNLNEMYLMPVNNGSTVYNCVLDFNIASTFSLPDYYTVDIRTYEIYREWYAFKNYDIGDRVIYYSKAYESVIVNNKTNNPRKFESAPTWESGTVYNVADVINYNADIYVYTGQGVTSSTASYIVPLLDTSNWLDVTEWKEIGLKPVDKIYEYRNIDNLNPFNFTVDSNISPYLVISVNSSNGYGINYSDRKNYEIRGILDIRELESFSNLTSKQYRSSLPSVYP